MYRSEHGVARKSVVLVVLAVLVAGALGVGLALVLRDTGTKTNGATTSVRIPAADFRPSTWGWVGCSNTHDAIFGYQEAPDSAHFFWPYEAFPTEYMSVKRWTNPQDRHWQRFDQAKQRYDDGGDPPVVWVQLCENLAQGDSNYSGPTSFDQVEQLLGILKEHAPTSIVFISPLHAYDPPTLCPNMGPGGRGIEELTKLANEAVDHGLAYPGPGTKGNPPLGPLKASELVRDGCHPTGGKHGAGPGGGPGTQLGVDVLGKQLAAFFDHLPRS